ncbi:MFS transporter [Ktedonobacter racemifer]|uniref:Major facilitator superfamily MFS_1 n=1 Tax=Ktedonobacter racemifer DSM 44963 TaxID=485913 RepID=D6TS57_KTERA|nr:MFS transporter [Ktedonobacter racemifer]EFH86130.1 major facilitator superfamily MFS_1 [Ktedonobacter racemifer DSM 44963]
MKSKTSVGDVASPQGETTEPVQTAKQSSFLRQPRAVWAIAFASVVSFMGLGLVDPILPAISQQLHATPAQVELLFTSYLLVTGIAMLITGAVSSWIGQKWTLLSGLALIIIFSVAAGSSSTINEIVGFRAGWGLGNALFISTALAVIVAVASGGAARAIILYEAALGLGISVGPLLGGALGSVSWRNPFYGVGILMLIALIAIIVLLPSMPRPEKRISILAPIRALRHRGLLTMGLTAFFYNFGFFTLLGYAPFPLRLDAHGLGLVYFGWGVLLAITSVFVAPRLSKRIGTLRSMYIVLALFAIDLLMMGFGVSSQTTLIVAVLLAGIFLGINNTLVTTAVMEVAPVERSVASAAYSFVRFIGGAIAPWLAGILAEWFAPQVPFYVGAGAVVISILVLFSGRAVMRHL